MSDEALKEHITHTHSIQPCPACADPEGCNLRENRCGILDDLHRRRQLLDEQRNKERRRHAEKMGKYDGEMQRLSDMIVELEQSPDLAEKMERVLALL